MKRAETTLRALRSQVQFELAQAAADVARAAGVSARTSQREATLERRAASLLVELRQIQGRAHLNAPLLDTMFRWRRREQVELREWQEHARRAREDEQRLRDALAALRNQERSLERALHAERRRQTLRADAAAAFRADELWLQHSVREVA